MSNEDEYYELPEPVAVPNEPIPAHPADMDNMEVDEDALLIGTGLFEWVPDA